MTIAKEDYYSKNRQWSDKFFKNKQVNRIIYKVLKVNANEIIDLEPASETNDRNYCIDYEIIIKTGKIACRIRNLERMEGKGVADKRDFSIRSKSNGFLTEIDKLQTAEVRWYLFCWAYGKNIIDWIFIDLDVFRETDWLEKKWLEIPNLADGTAGIYIPFEYLLENNCIVQYNSNIISDYAKKIGYRKPKNNFRSW